MKKILSLTLSVLMVITLAACNASSPKDTDNQNNGTSLFDDKSVQEWRDHYDALIDIDEDGNGTPDWQEKEMTIVYASNFYDDQDQYNTLFRNALKWAEQYPNITVERDSRFKKSAGGDDFTQLDLLVAASQEGTMPDVFYSPLIAEVYDQDLTLDLTPYLRTDEEATYIPQNTIDFLTSFDQQEIVGVAYMSVARMPAINVGLLDSLNIEAPSYNWTYADYEALRDQVGVVTDSGDRCVFPGVIDFSEIGPHYFDSIPNGWKGFNAETQRFDFASAENYGAWFEQVAEEGDEGWHFYDLSESQRSELCGSYSWPWGDGFEALGNIWFYELSTQANQLIDERELDIDVYPMPQAPEGGSTAMQAYYDTFSLSYELESDPVKAQAAFELVKWLSYGEKGTKARWAMIDEDIAKYGIDVDAFVANGGVKEDFPTVHPSTNLMDYIMGWPATTNPNVLENHPLVKGFDKDSPFAIFNFDAFKNEAFQAQLSGPIAYPRNIPATSNAYGHLNTWDIKDQIKNEGYYFSDIASEWDDLMNGYLDDYLRNYSK